MKLRLMVAAVALTALSAFAQNDMSKVEIKVTHVAGTVYMLEGAGGNIGVSVGEDGIIIVDDQFAPLAPKIREALKGITDRPIKFVLNTHFHGDHTGGNENFGADAPIIAQENVRKRLADGSLVMGATYPPLSKVGLPVITFKDNVTIHLNGEDIMAVHFPNGHTDGDSVIYFTQSNVIHMGDDFFNGFYPFIDIDHGGSVLGMIRDVDQVLNSAPTNAKMIPGHGPLGTAADLKGFVEMLRGTSGVVQKAIKKGRTLDQMKAGKILSPWDKWAHGFLTADMFLDGLYKDLSRK